MKYEHNSVVITTASPKMLSFADFRAIPGLMKEPLPPLKPDHVDLELYIDDYTKVGLCCWTAQRQINIWHEIGDEKWHQHLEEAKHPPIYWKPRSHLRFNDVDIPPWAGIGLLILDSMHLCITLFFRDSKVALQIHAWDHSETAFKVLKGSLRLGYDVLLLQGNSEAGWRERHFCEDYDQRDTKSYAESLQYLTFCMKRRMHIGEQANKKQKVFASGKRAREPEQKVFASGKRAREPE